jgi:hypothetical protein
MSDFDEFCKRLGVSLHRGPAAIAYAEANDLGELQIAAGTHLCFHAVRMMKTLPMPKYSRLFCRCMRTLSHRRWRTYYKLCNDAFYACALIDLRNVRDLFKAAHRWPELSGLLAHDRKHRARQAETFQRVLDTRFPKRLESILAG